MVDEVGAVMHTLLFTEWLFCFNGKVVEDAGFVDNEANPDDAATGIFKFVATTLLLLLLLICHSQLEFFGEESASTLISMTFSCQDKVKETLLVKNINPRNMSFSM